MKKLLLLFALCGVVFGYSQTQVSGRVIDEFGNAVPFANVIFVGTTIGTYSDDDGRFSLYAENRHREIEVSYVGFMTKKVRLESNNVKDITVILPEGEELSEVVIVGKPKKSLSKNENPAYPILQGIWRNKKKKGIENTEAYQYKKHSTVELGLNNLDTVFLQKTLKKEYDTIRKILSEKKYKETFSMPMYMKESIEKVYADNVSDKKRTDIEAERSRGVIDKGFGLERFSKAFDEFNIYDNSYMILNRPFVSPLSEFGYGVYHYVLNDSITDDERKSYKIYFFPKEDQDLALEGSFLVDAQTSIVKAIEMKTTPKTNINLVRSLFFEKKYNIVNDSVYLPEKEIYEGDFTFFSKSDGEKGLYVYSTVNYSEFVLNKPKEADFYEREITQVSKRQFEKTEAYWQQNVEHSERLGKAMTLIGEVGNTPRIRMVGNLIDVLGTGYVTLNNYLQFGSFWETISYNEVEGSRLKAGFRTFMSTEDRFRSYFYGAYGLSDKKFKYGVSAKYLISYSPRITVGAAYQNDNLQFGGILLHNDTQLNFLTPFNSLFARGKNFFLTRNKKIYGLLNFDLDENLQLTAFGTFQRSESADSRRFSIRHKKAFKPGFMTDFEDFNTGISLQYTPGRNVYGYGVERRYGKKLFSTYYLKLTKGVEGVSGSDFDYSKVQFFASRPIPVWRIGTSIISAEVGKTFGTVPLPILSPTPTNQAYSLTPQVFTMLDYYDFVTDTYLNGYFEHHFDGFIMNRIPLIKELRLRSLVFARFAHGTISKENIEASRSNIVYNAPEQLYWEYGFGFENIGFGNFRFIRLDFIWRNDFNDVNGVRNPKFGVRVGIAPIF